MRGEFIDVGGVRLYYYAAGTRGRGEPVVLVHGFPTSGHLWADVVPLLPGGHRIVVLDLLGYGRSDRPQACDLGIHAHADRVLALMDLLDIRDACVVGHGLGGGVAQSLAVRFPARVTRMGLVNSVGFDAWPTRNARMWRHLHWLVGLVPPPWAQSVLRTSLQRGYAHADRGVHSLEHYARVFAGPDGRTALVRHLRALESSETQALGARLRDVCAPTAIVTGRDDPFLPASLGERLRDAIPGATLDVIPSARHFAPEDTPAAVAAVITQLLTR
ncbi:MAG TPA: alpha/beta fold hydrolase [Gemmatimonadaceae bacterium]|jgi:pimeloyl-ACP methyl ester carboxylesterase|nr:alpha/beta fold hydrolase [Gemmatimonadaceae bacterium]